MTCCPHPGCPSLQKKQSRRVNTVGRKGSDLPGTLSRLSESAWRKRAVRQADWKEGADQSGVLPASRLSESAAKAEQEANTVGRKGAAQSGTLSASRLSESAWQVDSRRACSLEKEGCRGGTLWASQLWIEAAARTTSQAVLAWPNSATDLGCPLAAARTPPAPDSLHLCRCCCRCHCHCHCGCRCCRRWHRCCCHGRRCCHCCHCCCGLVLQCRRRPLPQLPAVRSRPPALTQCLPAPQHQSSPLCRAASFGRRGCRRLP